MIEVEIPHHCWYEDQPLKLTFPDDWRVHRCRVNSEEARPLSPAEIREAVLNPLGQKPLDKLAEGAEEVVIIFDDMISTGGTMALAVGLAKKCGARRVVAACTHPLLVGRAVERILGAGADEIVGTDSVPGPYSVVSVTPLIVEGLSDLL